MESPPSESPFKKDEPVSGSRFWIYLTGVSTLVWLGIALWHWGKRIQNETDFFMLATAAVLLGMLAVFLFQAGIAAGQCRQQRNFETMADAVRPQRRVWAILAILGTAGGVCFSVWALQHRPINDYIRTLLQQQQQQQLNQQQSADKNNRPNSL